MCSISVPGFLTLMDPRHALHAEKEERAEIAKMTQKRKGLMKLQRRRKKLEAAKRAAKRGKDKDMEIDQEALIKELLEEDGKKGFKSGVGKLLKEQQIKRELESANPGGKRHKLCTNNASYKKNTSLDSLNRPSLTPLSKGRRP